MKKLRLFLTSEFCFLTIMLLFASMELLARHNKKPNILWISCEDISPRLGCYGDEVADTPNLDQFASEGIRFNNTITTSPVCAPVRTGIITGMYPTSIGAHNMRTTRKGSVGGLPTPYYAVPPHYVKAFPEYLRAAGYYCTNNAKTDYQFGNQKTIWDESSLEAHYKNRPDKDQPFFAVFNFTNTHESKNWDEGNVTNPDDIVVPPYYPNTKKVRKSIARSYDNIHEMDRMTGELLKELDELGLADNTIVFYWSDHGDGMPRGKRWLYDSGTKIPMIIRWPGVAKAGSINNELISTVDFAPTVLSMAGVTIPPHMQGRIFLGDKKMEEPKYVFSHRDRFDEAYDMIRSVRSKEFLYIRNYYPEKPYIIWVPYRNRSPIMEELFRLQREEKLNDVQNLWMASCRPPIEFYDVKADPYQINNLADDPKHSITIDEMSASLDNWRITTKDLGDYSEEELLNIWWKDGIQPTTSKPVIIPNTSKNPGREYIAEGTNEIEAPAMIDFHCPTQGASITFTLEDGDKTVWKIYHGPIKLQKGKTNIRAIACRYGYNESDEFQCTINVR